MCMVYTVGQWKNYTFEIRHIYTARGQMAREAVFATPRRRDITATVVYVRRAHIPCANIVYVFAGIGRVKCV